MTEKELKQLYFLNRETKRLQKDLEELEQWSGCSPAIMTGMPRGGTKRDLSDYAAEIADIKAIISLNLQRIQLERARLERYIGSIEDSEMRLIMRLRHINGMSWESIGYEVNMDRRTVSRKYYSSLKLPTMPTENLI